jgi:hypothetical protein
MRRGSRASEGNSHGGFPLICLQLWRDSQFGKVQRGKFLLFCLFHPFQPNLPITLGPQSGVDGAWLGRRSRSQPGYTMENLSGKVGWPQAKTRVQRKDGRYFLLPWQKCNSQQPRGNWKWSGLQHGNFLWWMFHPVPPRKLYNTPTSVTATPSVF